VLTKDKNIRTI